MGFFNVGPTEILVIMIVVLLIFGPDQLSEMAKKLGQAQRHLNKTYDTFNEQMLKTLQDAPEPAKKPAESPSLPATNPTPAAADPSTAPAQASNSEAGGTIDLNKPNPT